MNTTLVIPEKISEERVRALLSKGIDEKIARIDLEMIKMKMAGEEEELNWTEFQLEEAEVEYKRYLTLCVRYPYPAHSIVPNKVMDTMWHYHILDTRAYHRDCEVTFCHYFHHYPYFGLRGEADAQNLRTAFDRTKEFYEKEFGEPLVREGASDCWHDCENRCWHACASRA
jgi:hypothetical protein